MSKCASQWERAGDIRSVAAFFSAGIDEYILST